jgi:hypothetical protein
MRLLVKGADWHLHYPLAIKLLTFLSFFYTFKGCQ